MSKEDAILFCKHAMDMFYGSNPPMNSKVPEPTKQTIDISKVDRFEVIDDTGIAYVRGPMYGTPVKVEVSLQDDGRTLKVFVTEQLKESNVGNKVPIPYKLGNWLMDTRLPIPFKYRLGDFIKYKFTPVDFWDEGY